MENRRFINHKFILGGALLSVLLVLVNASPIFAYSQNTTHPALTDEIANFYNLSFTDKTITQEEKQWLIKGSIDEDDGGRFFSHFYDPVYDRGLQSVFTAGVPTFSSKKWAFGGTQKDFYNSQMTGYAAISGADSIHDFSYDRAIQDYAKGDKQRAFIAFGHVLHLLEDAGVPDHTRNDPHPPVLDLGSPYEHEMAKWNPDNFQVVSRLVRNREKPVVLSDIGSYLDRVANYSNNNFFSRDTISNREYIKPSINNLKRIRVNGTERLFVTNQDKNGADFPIAFVQEEKDGNINFYVYSSEIGSYILDGYWERLSKEVVISGAGALKLFLEEAEIAKKEYLAKQEQKKPSFWAQIASLFGFGGNNSDELAELGTSSTSDANDELATPDIKPLPVVTNNGDSGDAKGDNKMSPSLSPLVSPKPSMSPKLSPSPTPTPPKTPTPSPTPKLSAAKTLGRVVVNEIAWAGTSASATDEWVELYNTENTPVDISSWQLVSTDDSPDIIFPEGTIIQANSYFLIERTDDNTISDTTADLAVSFGQGGLSNTGEIVRLFDSAGAVVDVVGGAGEAWYFGDSISKNSMERIDPMKAGNNASNWKNFSGTPTNKDASGNSINGTPKTSNSTAIQVVTSTGGGGGSGSGGGSSSSTPTPIPSPSVTPSPSPEPEEESSTEKININTANKEELMSLPGIGEVKSQAIIDYRTTNGPFAQIEDIQNVSGIGPVTFNNIKDLITVGDVASKPSVVTNLIAAHGSPTITATWTAPDPGDYNTASLSYDLRYSSTSFSDAASESWWSVAIQVASSSLPSVGIKGAQQGISFNVVPEYGLTLYLALRTKVIHSPTCDVGHADKCSGISNVATVSFPTALDHGAWAMFGKDQFHTSFADVVGPGLTATVSWEFNELESGYIVSQPVADADGNIYFGATDGSSHKLIKLNKNGVKQWEYETYVSIGTPAVLSDGTVYFGRIGAGGVLAFTALASDGSDKWDYVDTSTVLTFTVSSKGEPHLTYTSGTDKLAVLNADGSIKTPFPISASGLSGFAPVVLDDGIMIVAGKVSGNQFFTTYSSDSAQLWQVSYAGANGSTPANPSYDKATGITYSAAGPKLFNIPSDGSILNSSSIAPWDYSAATMVAISSDTLYVGFNSPSFASGSQVFALNKSDLAAKWPAPFQADGLLNAQLAVDGAGNVYFSTQNGKLFSVDNTGNQRWAINSGSNSTISPALTEHGLVWGYGGRVVLAK